jgi:hypothetical protein
LAWLGQPHFRTSGMIHSHRRFRRYSELSILSCGARSRGFRSTTCCPCDLSRSIPIPDNRASRCASQRNSSFSRRLRQLIRLDLFRILYRDVTRYFLPGTAGLTRQPRICHPLRRDLRLSSARATRERRSSDGRRPSGDQGRAGHLKLKDASITAAISNWRRRGRQRRREWGGLNARREWGGVPTMANSGGRGDWRLRLKMCKSRT